MPGSITSAEENVKVLLALIKSSINNVGLFINWNLDLLISRSCTTGMSKKKVLIVEDDNFVAEVYSTKLLEMGHEVVVAQNGEEGLAKVGEARPDLILLDIIMPVMGWIEMLEELKKKEEWKNIPVILLTNVGEKESVQKVRDLGVQNYLIKSHFTPAEVIEKIESVLGK